MITAGVVRLFLIVDIAALSLLALIYLRQRRMSSRAWAGWGLLALFVPVLGPFLVIANRPGDWDPEFSIKSDFGRVGAFLRCLFPEPPPKVTRLERARERRKLRKQ